MPETIKARLYILGFFILFSSPASAEMINATDAPFKFVDHDIGTKKSHVYFKWVVINELYYDVSAEVKSIKVSLKRNPRTFTTINISSATKSQANSQFLRAAKVTITVRRKNDLIIWKKFLQKIKAKQELERKRLLEPIRVLPSLDVH